MTKADIVNSLYEKIGLSKKETAHIVEVVLETIKGNLEQRRENQAGRIRELRGSPQGGPQGPQPEDGRGNRDFPAPGRDVQAEPDPAQGRQPLIVAP